MKRTLLMLIASAAVCNAGDIIFYNQYRIPTGTVESDGRGGFIFYDQHRIPYQTVEPDGIGGFTIYDRYRIPIGTIDTN